MDTTVASLQDLAQETVIKSLGDFLLRDDRSASASDLELCGGELTPAPGERVQIFFEGGIGDSDDSKKATAKPSAGDKRRNEDAAGKASKVHVGRGFRTGGGGFPDTRPTLLLCN